MNGGLQNTGNQGSEMELFGKDPLVALEKMEKFVKVIAAKCRGKQFVSEIEGRNYARAEWWSAVGGSLSIFANTDRIENLDNETETKRRAWVQLFRNGVPFGPKASGLCSSLEVLQNKRTKEIKSRWLDPNGRPEEYAIDSMATTRATSKAFRQSMGILPVLAGLEATPAEEMDGVRKGSTAGGILVVCPDHSIDWFKSGNMRGWAHKHGNSWCNRTAILTRMWQETVDKHKIDMKAANEILKDKYQNTFSGLTDEQKAEVLGDVSIVTGEPKKEESEEEGDPEKDPDFEVSEEDDPETLQTKTYRILNQALENEKISKDMHEKADEKFRNAKTDKTYMAILKSLAKEGVQEATDLVGEQ